jgi:hypothetical protein
VDDVPVGHQDVEETNEQVVNRLNSRSSVCELNTELCTCVHNSLHEHQDREVLNSPAVAAAVPKQSSSEVHIARYGIVSEGCSLVSLFSHQAKTNVSRLNHIYVVGTVPDGQSDFSAGKFLHKSDNLGFLAWRRAINDNRLSSYEKCTKLRMHKRVVEGNSNDHAGDQYLVTLDAIDCLYKVLDFLEKICGICVMVLENHNVLGTLDIRCIQRYSEVLLSGEVLGWSVVSFKNFANIQIGALFLGD